MTVCSSILADLTSPLRLEYLSIPAAAALFACLSLPVIWLGVRSLNWLGATRKWVSISLRLSLIWVLVLLLSGTQWVRQNRDLDVIVLRDTSVSTNSVIPPPGKTLGGAEDELIRSAARSKRPNDCIGIVDFSRNATIEAPPDDHLRLDSHPIAADGDGTDIASALRVALASFRPDAMRRMVLVSDGNATQGDTDASISAAASMNIPIDVLPLHYRIQRDVLVDRMIAPTCTRVNEPFTLDVILRSTSATLVSGTLQVTHKGVPIDSRHVDLRAGANVIHIKIPAQSRAGLAEFRATFQADRALDDALPANNTAESFTFLRGESQILFVNGEVGGEVAGISSSQPGEGASAAGSFIRALGSAGIHPTQVSPSEFPGRAVDLQPYDAIVLANVSRGPSGLSPIQDRLLAHYVRDLGGGLLMIGGPDSFGPGNWHGSEVEKILPVDCDIPALRDASAGALVIVLDHSGSMSDFMPGSITQTKQQVAADSAILAVNALQPQDQIGVVAFAENLEWAAPLAPNGDPDRTAASIRAMTPTEGTNICPALEAACGALQHLDASEVSVKRIILLTDGVSEAGDYDRLLKRCRASKIALSTIAIGGDADRRLLKRLADGGGGAMYAVDSANQLRQVFIREARMLRRPLIHEPAGGIDLVQDLAEPMPKLSGMVLTSLKSDRTVHASMLAAGAFHNPVLAEWNIGLGRAAVFTSDITTRWAAQWIASPNFARFWAQRVRSVQRAAMSDDFDVRLTRDGSQTRLIVEAANTGGAARGFVFFSGKMLGPNDTTADIALQQTGPGRYEAMLQTGQSGNYAAFMQYRDPAAKTGSLLAGISVPASAELRDMQSNDAYLTEIASRTGGRVLQPLDDGGGAGLFSRKGLSPSVASRSISDLLLCMLMGMLVTDVAVRRIHWEWNTVKHWAFVGFAAVEGFTTTRKIDAQSTLAALLTVHQKVHREPPRRKPVIEPAAAGIESTINLSPALSASRLGSLKLAKQRAIEEIRQKEKGDRR